MKRKITGAVALAGAFFAGMLVAAALGWGITASEAKTPGAAAQQQAQKQVTVQQVISSYRDGRGHRFAA